MKRFGCLLACLVGMTSGVGCGATPLDPISTSGAGGSIGSYALLGTGGSSEPSNTGMGNGPRGTGGSSEPSNTGNSTPPSPPSTPIKIDVTGVTGGTRGTPGSNPVAWKTSTVTLTAEDFWIVSDGQRFTSQVASIAVHSDPGDSKYTTLELIWTEHDREMRIILYFKADADSWWSYEMRTYVGQEDGEWLYYHGPFIKTPMGAPFRGDIDFKNDSTDKFRGEIHLHGVEIITTLTGE
jgi:hypothetical protein